MTFCLGQIKGAQSTIQSTDQMRYLMTGGICVQQSTEISSWECFDSSICVFVCTCIQQSMARYLDLGKSHEIQQRDISLDHEISFSKSRPRHEIRDLMEPISRSRLEARDVEDTNLNLVSNHEIKKILISSRKKTRSIFIFFAEIFCAIISKHCFFHFHLAYM